MTPAKASAKARKGDLILIEEVIHNFYSVAAEQEARAAGREVPAVSTYYRFGIVASSTRDGQVKTWRELGFSGHASTIDARRRRWVTSAKKIDVEAVVEAARAHHWPGHPDSPMPFSSFSDAVAVARPFLRRSAEVS